MNNAERDHLDRVASLGCIVCGAAADIHHLKGHPWSCMGKRASHYDTIPLCHVHHQTGGYGVAFHAGQKAWQARFGTQAELLKKVQEKLEQ
ncbi:Ref family recombination enhancement nuclease [Jiella pelagia]|uniref:Ref family recombination enhancement nuclease n=1 Tax=Jiella pelagia TaxID=2986949 RepID=UPI0038B316C2